jgi:hypothetical protein
MTEADRSYPRLPWASEEVEYLKSLFSETDSSRQLHALFTRKYPNRSHEALKDQCKRQGLLRTDTTKALLTRPQSVAKLAWDAIPRFDRFERLSGDFAVSSDWHLSKLDPTMLALKGKVARKHGIKRALIIGDVFDMEEFSHWSIAGLQPRDVKFGDELIFAARAFEQALAAFPEGIWVTSGNHDERILKLLRFALELSDVFSLIGRRMAEGLRKQFEDKVKVSSYPYCHINSTWYCCHPSCYSKIAMAVARDIAEVEHMHTIMAGGHLWGMTIEKSGKYYAIDCGCMCDPKKVYYKQMRIRRFPAWKQGFVILKDGLPMLYDRNMAENC